MDADTKTVIWTETHSSHWADASVHWDKRKPESRQERKDRPDRPKDQDEKKP